MKQITPSFYIIGAQKAGTTTLHHWLASHPQVGLPKRKETHFFSHNERFALGPEWYQKQFPSGTSDTLYGEIDPDYLFSDMACKRIHQLGGSPRFVVVVREPLSRAYSHYCMSVRRGLEKLSFDQALDAEARRLNSGNSHHIRHHSYMARSQYTQQIERYHRRFGTSAVLILTFDELFDPKSCLSQFKRLCTFMGLNKTHSPDMMQKKYNAAGMVRFKFISDLLWRKDKWPSTRKIVRRFVPLRELKYRISHLLDNANHKKMAKGDRAITAVGKHILHQANQETEHLAAATGLNLNHWIRTIP